MAWNTYKPRGAAKGYEPDSGSAVTQSVPKFGIVKDNIDPLRCGRLRVYVEGMSGLNPDDADSWVTVQYMSAFYGQTISTSAETGYGSYKTNPHSYGMWSPAPDIGTRVVVLFINGDPNFGVWIGAIPEPATLQMVPAIGAAIPGVKVVPNEGEANSLGGATRLPAANVNDRNTSFMTSPKFLFESRPVHSYVAGILFQQGLIRDPLRGVISSSAQREAPSRVMGISTPGRPNYAGGYTDQNIASAIEDGSTSPESFKVVSRRGGHSLVMDDGDIVGRDQLIRLRTALGHQILMSDDGQCLFIIHSNGKSWIELGKEGTIDMFSTNSVNVRTAGDLNLHADNNINIHAKKSINMKSESLNIESSKDTNVRVGGNYAQQVVGKYTVKVAGAMSMASSREGSYYSDATMYINGSRINLNSGKASTVPQNVKPIPLVMHTDTLFDSSAGWLAAPGKLESIVSRAPAHTPWDPAGSGVPVKVELNASTALPAAPSPAVAAASSSAATGASTPAGATPATTNTVPKVDAVSEAIDSTATAAAVSARAAAMANGPAAAAAATNGGITTINSIRTVSIGQTNVTPDELSVAGIIKPGAEILINGAAAAGKNIEKALPPNVFAGIPGAENLQKIATNVTSQTQAIVKNLQNAQAGLTAAGVITGKESASGILGTVMAAATNGVAATVNTIKNSANALVTGATTALTGAVSAAAGKLMGSVNQVMNLGNKAAGIAGAMGGGMSAISGSLSAMAAGFGKAASGLIDSARGATAGAFAALKASLPKLQAGIPQDVKKIAEEAANKAQNSGSDLLNTASKFGSTLTDAANSAIGTATGSLSALSGAAQAAASAATKSINDVAGTVNKIGLDANKLITAGSGVASGLNLIPGGVSAVMAQANNVNQTINQLSKSATDTVQSLSAGVNTGLNSITNAVGGAKTAISSAAKLAGDPAAIINSAKNSALSSITGAAGSLKNQIAGAGGSITDLAIKGLPTAEIGKLRGAIAGLSSGDNVVSLPVTAVNTADFGQAVDQALATITGPGISPPNFNGNPATMGQTVADQLLEKTAQLNTSVVETANNLSTVTASVSNAQATFNKLVTTLPEGAPEIAAAKKALDSAVTAGTTIGKNATTLMNNFAGSLSKTTRNG